MKDTRFFKFLVLVNAGVPLLILGYDALNKSLGANPVNYAIRTTGMLALIFLTLSLTVTPVRKLTGLNWLISARRTLGLYAFFYASLHFAIFFGLDQSLSVKNTLGEIVKRPYLLVGMAGVALMLPLAITSTNKMIRRLGTKRWQQLHRLAYLAAGAGVLHYYMLVKADLRLPVAFAVTLGVLLGYRLVTHYLNLRTAAPGQVVAPGKGKAFNQTAAPAALAAVSPAPEPKFWKGQLQVARTFDETPTVRTFRLVPTFGDVLPFDFKPGQYLNFSFKVDGKKVNRSYSIASPPTRNAYCEITVKREEMGVASGHLHGKIMPGERLDVSGPAGKFTFTGQESDSIVLIGAGVGITPLMSKIRALTDRAWPGDIFLIFSVRSESEFIFRDELELLQKRFPNLKQCVTVTRDASPAWRGHTGRIDVKLIRQFVPEFITRRFHLCGPTEMTEATKTLLGDMGVPDTHIDSEAFTPGGAMKTESAMKTETSGPSDVAATEKNTDTPPVKTPDEAGVVTFASSGKSASISADLTILDAAEACGVEIPFECRAGICGSCKIILVSGDVTMDNQDALDASDRAKQMILACQAHAHGPVTVVA